MRGALRKKINARKKRYIEFLEEMIGRVQEQPGVKRQLSPRLAAFALLGIINWLYQWYRPDGPVKESELTQTYLDFFFRGLLGAV